MFEYNGPESAKKEAQRILAYIGLPNIPEGLHRNNIEALQLEASAFIAVTRGTEALYSALQDSELSLSESVRSSLVEALGLLSRAAIEWRAANKIDRWIELQVWAWATHNEEEVLHIPEAL